MSEIYDATYAAVRSKLSGGDISSAVESAIRDCGIGDQVHSISQHIQQVAAAYCDPSVLYRPALTRDENLWCALYGANLQEGISGYGDTPSLAMQDFDRNWHAKILPKEPAV